MPAPPLEHKNLHRVPPGSQHRFGHGFRGFESPRELHRRDSPAARSPGGGSATARPAGHVAVRRAGDGPVAVQGQAAAARGGRGGVQRRRQRSGAAEQSATREKPPTPPIHEGRKRRSGSSRF